MSFVITLLILILVLGGIVFIHELGHFLAAKKIEVYVHEFAVGMGPEIFSFHRKNDETKYSLRAMPLGGYNALANDMETSKGLKKNQVLENKSFMGRLFVLIMGIVFNFILAIVLLFANGLIYGSPTTDPIIGSVLEGSAAQRAGLIDGDLILKVNDKSVSSFDEVLLETRFGEIKDSYTFLVQRGNVELSINVVPDIKEEDGNKTPTFGFTSSNIREKGFVNAIKYSFVQTWKTTKSVFEILGKLVTGKIGAENLSGPIGVFSVIDNVKQNGLESIIYLMAYLSINVGVINLIPVPVFDGGRILLLFIEKIKGKKVNPKLETYLNTAGTVLLVLLMIYVTLNDILKLF